MCNEHCRGVKKVRLAKNYINFRAPCCVAECGHGHQVMLFFNKMT